MRIQELLEGGDAFLGREVTVSGRILVSGDDRAYLAPDARAFDRGEFLPVRDGGRIAAHLSGVLPVYVGGPFLFDEECVITGSIERDSGSFQLCGLRRCTVRWDDQEVDVPFGA